MLYQKLDIGFAFAQGGNSDRDHAQAVIQVFAELAFFNFFGQLLVRRGNNTHIHFRVTRITDPAHFSFLEHTQQAHLKSRRGKADFIQEDRTAVSSLKQADFVGIGTGERAFDISEQF